MRDAFDPERSDPREENLRGRLVWLADGGILVCLVILAAGLPFADITTSREISIVVGAILVVVKMALTGKWEWIRTPLDLPLALFTLTGLISLATALDPSYTFDELRGELFKCLLIYYLAVHGLRTEDRAKLVLSALLLGALVMDAYSLIHFLSQGRSLAVKGLGEPGLHRGPQELGTYLIQAAPFLMFAIILVRKRWARIALAGFFMFHVLVIHVTFSRMVVLALVIEAALFLFFLGVSWKLILGGLAASVLILAFFMPRPILHRELAHPESGPFMGLGLTEQESRLGVWTTTLKHIYHHPFRGTGFGRRSFARQFPEIKKRLPQIWHAHNTFLNLALNLGVQGLLAFGLVLFQIIRGLWPGRGRDLWSGPTGLTRAVMAAALVMTIGFFTRNMTDDIYNNDAALLFWLLIGCAFSLKVFGRIRDTLPTEPGLAG